MVFLTTLAFLELMQQKYAPHPDIVAFFEQYDDLKKTENWDAILDLGEKAFANQALEKEDKALIACRLASSYFYRAKYDLSLEMSSQALKDAQEAQNPSLQARGYYLQSAVYRTFVSKFPDQAETYKALAQSTIQSGIDLVSANEIRPGIAAKVYFNAGALEHDVYKNLSKASLYYGKAMEYFAKDSDDYNRTAIRQARLLLEDGKPKVAKLEAMRLKIEPNTKTEVQFLQTLAKIHMGLQEYQKGFDCVAKALNIPLVYKMPREQEMLRELMQKIKQADPFVSVTPAALVNQQDAGQAR